MSNPSPKKISRLKSKFQSLWEDRERRLVDPDAFLQRILIISGEHIQSLQGHYNNARLAATGMKEMLPIARKIASWVTAGLFAESESPAQRKLGIGTAIKTPMPFAGLCEALRCRREDAAKLVFGEIDRQLMEIILNEAPLKCPLCGRKK
jgi:hypothetical protein